MEQVLCFHAEKEKALAYNKAVLQKNGYVLRYMSSFDELCTTLEREDITFLVIRSSSIRLLSKLAPIFPLQKVVVSINDNDDISKLHAMSNGFYEVIREPHTSEDLIALLKYYARRCQCMTKEKIFSNITTLYETMISMHDVMQFEDRIRTSMQGMAEWVGVDTGSLILYNREKETFELVASIGIDAEVIKKDFDVSKNIMLNRIMAERKPIVLNDTVLESLNIPSFKKRPGITSSVIGISLRRV